MGQSLSEIVRLWVGVNESFQFRVATRSTTRQLDPRRAEFRLHVRRLGQHRVVAGYNPALHIFALAVG